MSTLHHGLHSPRQPSSRRMGRRRVSVAAMMTAPRQRTCSHHLLATIRVSCKKPVLVAVAGLCSADYPAAAHLTTVCATPVQAQAAEC